MQAGQKAVEGIESACDQITVPYCIASNRPHAKVQNTLSITGLLSRFENRLISSDRLSQDLNRVGLGNAVVKTLASKGIWLPTAR
jgi:phosphoglycolate phosphatase-like HAD superfamily hydrolase